MNITQELIEKMKQDHRERFNEEITDEEAKTSLESILDVFNTLLKWDKEREEGK